MEWLEILKEWFATLQFDWGVLVMVAGVYLSVWGAGKAGLAESAASKKLGGALAGLVFAAVRLAIQELVPNEEIALWLANALVAWLAAALSHEGIKVVRDGIKARA